MFFHVTKKNEIEDGRRSDLITGTLVIQLSIQDCERMLFIITEYKDFMRDVFSKFYMG